MFGGKGKIATQAALKTIMNVSKSEGNPIRDHMIRMIRLFNKMEIFRVEIDKEKETQVDMVLEILSDSFK